MDNLKKKIYFKNLDGLRCVGAIVIIVHHIEQNKDTFKIPNFWHNPTLHFLGPLSLNMFFTLSGFLITYLLLQEYNNNSGINIKSFYIRRILKIWPLYFVLVILGFFVLPAISLTNSFNLFDRPDYLQRLILFLTFLPNVSYIINGTTPFIHQLWSISVEEQFYLIWPLLILISPKKLTSVIAFLFGYLLLLVLLSAFVGPETDLYRIIAKARISAMAVGGIAAYATYYKLKGSSIIQNPVAAWLVFITLMVFLCFQFYLPYIGYEFYAAMYAFMIAHLATTPKPIFSLENKFGNYLGKISYGLYLYHSIMIFLSIKLLVYLNLQNIQVLVYALSFFSTIFVSYLSFEYFEKYFLKKKTALAKV